MYNPESDGSDVCEVCGLMVEGCACPGCGKCGEVGRLDCYTELNKEGTGCGMELSNHQKTLRRLNDEYAQLVENVQIFSSQLVENVQILSSQLDYKGCLASRK